MENPLVDNKHTGEDSSPPYFDGADEFNWPELSSSGELSDINDFPITIVSVPTTPESTPIDAVSAVDEVTENLGVSERKSNNLNDAAVIRNDIDDGGDEEEERENVSNSCSRKDLKLKNSKMKRKGSAMECLIRVLKQMYKVGDEKNEEMVDLLETVKRRGITFPRPRGYDS